MSTSLTPRTDANTHWTTSHDGFFELEPNPKGHWVTADFARELERELAALRRNNLLLTEILHKTLEDYALVVSKPPTPNTHETQTIESNPPHDCPAV